jgi:lipoteichoic acid synthase
MKDIFYKIESLLSKKLSFFFLAVILFWLKTYAVYLAEFNLGITDIVQTFLLFVNPISSALFFLGIALLFKGRKRSIAIIVINLILSIILYANVCYYRFFNDFITLPVLAQSKNYGDVSGSAVALMKPYDVLYFLDTLILVALLVFKKVENYTGKLNRRMITGVFAAAISIFIVNLGIAEINRPELLSRTFDRNYIVKYLGLYNYTIYDAVQTTKTSAQRAMADSNDIVDVQNYLKANKTNPDSKLFGKAKGMNVIFVSMESFQNFMINQKVNGQEVTPFLDKLTHDPNTFYFDNFFHQTGQGKTSDAEFMMENGLFPLSNGAVFTLKAMNTYQATPAILNTMGYSSAVLHGNYKTFWNRDEMYKSLGYDRFFDASYFDMSTKNTINYGMEDKPFFKEAMPYLKNFPQPFYTKFITLSNHFPFELREKSNFPTANTGDSILDNYFKTANYMDQSLEQFFTYLKQSGLYDHTVIVMYGDHYGISESHDAALAKVLGKKTITPFDNAQLQRVPLFIHVPGVKGKIDHTYGGEVDVRSTILHLLGVDTKNYIDFGSDLLSKDHDQVVPFRNGDYVTPKYTQVKGICYSNSTGGSVDPKQCVKNDNIIKTKLNMSDKVVNDDLLRFYTPPGFKPVNRENYDYTSNQRINPVPGRINSTKTNDSNKTNTPEKDPSSKK